MGPVSIGVEVQRNTDEDTPSINKGAINETKATVQRHKMTINAFLVDFQVAYIMGLQIAKYLSMLTIEILHIDIAHDVPWNIPAI